VSPLLLLRILRFQDAGPFFPSISFFVAMLWLCAVQ
jgi:hypothetical protein